MVTGVLFGSMFLLMLMDVPIVFAMGLAAAAGLLMLPHVGLEVVAQRMFFGLDSFVILAVPLFLFLGELMESAKITDRLAELAEAVVGHLPGGMGHAAIVTNMIMAGISGSGTADAAATATVLVPAMTKTGYPTAFAAALVGAAATIGPVIPPSIIMVIYASIANVSVGRLFLGGIIPGLLMGGWLMGLTALFARRMKLPRGPYVGLMGMARATRRAALVLVTPFIVVAGIVGGVFTPTELAAIAGVYALLLGLVVYRTVRPSGLPEIVRRTAWTTGKVMFVLSTASILSWVLARADVPAQLARMPFLSDTEHPWVLLLSLNVLLLTFGAVIEAIPALVIITPMILPLAIKAGIDPVHLGVVMTVNLSIGLIIPPVGSIVFVMCGLSRVNIMEFTREVAPFIVALIVPLLLATYIPPLVLFIPTALMGPG